MPSRIGFHALVFTGASLLVCLTVELEKKVSKKFDRMENSIYLYHVLIN